MKELRFSFGNDCIGYCSCCSGGVPCCEEPSVLRSGKVIQEEALLGAGENPGATDQVEAVAVNGCASEAKRRKGNRCKGKACESVSYIFYPNGFIQIQDQVLALDELPSQLCFYLFNLKQIGFSQVDHLLCGLL